MIREIGGSYFKGEGTKLTDYVCYGAPIHAVANGIVVAAVDNLPQVPPNTTTAENPTLHGPANFSGNSGSSGVCSLFTDPIGRPLSPVSMMGMRRRQRRRARRLL